MASSLVCLFRLRFEAHGKHQALWEACYHDHYDLGTPSSPLLGMKMIGGFSVIIAPGSRPPSSVWPDPDSGFDGLDL